MYKAFLFATSLTLGSACGAQQAPAIGWSLEASGPHRDGREVQLTVDSRWSPGSHSTWSNSRDPAELGLTPARVMSPTQPVRFTFAREAGRLDCGGTLGGGRGEGACTFTPDSGFSTFLDARRI